MSSRGKEKYATGTFEQMKFPTIWQFKTWSAGRWAKSFHSKCWNQQFRDHTEVISKGLGFFWKLRVWLISSSVVLLSVFRTLAFMSWSSASQRTVCPAREVYDIFVIMVKVLSSKWQYWHICNILQYLQYLSCTMLKYIPQGERMCRRASVSKQFSCRMTKLESCRMTKVQGMQFKAACREFAEKLPPFSRLAKLRRIFLLFWFRLPGKSSTAGKRKDFPSQFHACLKFANTAT